MRCYQEIGLTPEARQFVLENTKMVPNITCPDCGKVITERLDCKEYRFEEMFYEDGAHLLEYQLKDGRVAREIVQCSPWSSGPMAFFCLEIENQDGTKERVFEWDEEEINNY